MCPICWTIALLVVLGFGANSALMIWATENNALAVALMMAISTVFWLSVGLYIQNKRKKGKCGCSDCKCDVKDK